MANSSSGAARCVYSDDAGRGTAAQPLVVWRGVDTRRARTGRAGWWHGGAAHGPMGASVPRREGPRGRPRRAHAACAPASDGQCPRAPCSSKIIPSSLVQERFSPIFSTEVVQGFYAKVVHHTTLYNFSENSRVFFSTS
jgi:hypothetical protein